MALFVTIAKVFKEITVNYLKYLQMSLLPLGFIFLTLAFSIWSGLVYIQHLLLIVAVLYSVEIDARNNDIPLKGKSQEFENRILNFGNELTRHSGMLAISFILAVMFGLVFPNHPHLAVTIWLTSNLVSVMRIANSWSVYKQLYKLSKTLE